MKLLRISLLTALAALMLAACTGVPKGIEPVRGFDAGRYLGTWYEIARLDHSFERGLDHVSATYTKRQDGGIDVLNRGYDPARKVWREAKGKAYFIGDADRASLKVSFFGPFYGGYHVFALNPDYRWALVSGPTRDYFWMLARQPTLSPDIGTELLAKARDAGFDTSAIVFPAAGPDPSAK